jgi:3-deoxy-D-manno-octulosonic-acid transferase
MGARIAPEASRLADVLALYRLIQWLLSPFQRRIKVPSLPEGCLYAHASSMGEVSGAVPLLSRIQRENPDVPILFSVFTESGLRRAKELTRGMNVVPVRFPGDRRGAIRSMLLSSRPLLALVFETELWPNLLTVLAEHGVPIFLVNARMTEKTMRRYGAAKKLARGLLSSFEGVFPQTEVDARRFVQLGADPACVKVLGSLKFDIECKRSEALRREALGYGAQDVLCVFGSLRPDEEDVALEALRVASSEVPELSFVLAPRHGDRAKPLSDKLNTLGFKPILRSQSEAGKGDVLVLDTLGELNDFYGIADIAFVGGTLAPYGGHNLIEPAFSGVPVLFGPHLANVRDTATGLIGSGGGILVRGSDELSSWLVKLGRSPELRTRMGGKAKGYISSQRGVVERTYREIAPILKESSS